VYVFALGCAADPGNHYNTKKFSEKTELQSWKGLVLLGYFTDAEAEAQIQEGIYLGPHISGKQREVWSLITAML
jgi:hypothetical protein